MSTSYEEWLSKILASENQDLDALDSILIAVEQFLSAPESIAAKGILITAAKCSRKYVDFRHSL